MELLEPKAVDIETAAGPTKRFIISKFPAIPGREILTQYPVTAAPKVGEYQANEALMLKLMAYVAVEHDDGSQQRLTNAALVNNHVPDPECLMRLEWAMLEYNCSFFAKGKLSDILARMGQQFMSSIIETLKHSTQS